MTLNEVMKETADAIREKTGKSELIKPIDFATEIKGITAGGGSGGGAKTTYYRYDRDNALSVFGDKSSEFTFMLYANRLCGLDIIGIQTGGNFSMFAENVYQVMADGVRLELSYIATTPNAVFGKAKPDIAAMVTNMHDFIRLIGKEMMQWSEEQINAAVALFTEISEEEFFAAITK
jgi:hypothetical protein